MSFSRRCRLCLSNNSSNVGVFSKSRANQNLQAKVLKLFSVMMTPNDSYPNYLCKSCMTQLETFHRFSLAVEATQQEIQKILLIDNAHNELVATNSVSVHVPFFEIVIPTAEYTTSDSSLTAPDVLTACEDDDEVKIEPPEEDPLNTEHFHNDQSVFGMETRADGKLRIENRIEFVNVKSIFMETSAEDSQSNFVQNKEINIAQIKTRLQIALHEPSQPLITVSSDSDTGSYTSDIASSHYTEPEAALTNNEVSYAFDSETSNAISTTTKSPHGADLTQSNLTTNVKSALAKVHNVDLGQPNSSVQNTVFTPEDESDMPVYWSYEDSLLPRRMTKHDIEQSRKKLHEIDDVYDFTCQSCRIKFVHYKSLSLHCLHEHGKAAIVSCCNVDMSTNEELLKHLFQHIRDNWTCGTCGVKCVTRDNFTQHAVTHSQQKERNFNCKKCHRIFYDLSTLKEHMKTTFHRGDPPKIVYRYRCDVCNHKLRSKRTFKAHWSRLHAPKLYACYVCSKRFGSKQDLKNHNISRHLNTKPVKCPICDRKFKLMSKLKIHMVMHKKWQCHKCPNACPNAMRLAEHRRQAHHI